MARSCLLVMLGLAACYAPRLGTGAPCPDGVCPEGLVCSSATRTCEVTNVVIDADIDAPIDAATGPCTIAGTPVCLGSGLSMICIEMPAAPLTIAAATVIDTDASPLCLTHAGSHPCQFCVIAGTTVTVQAQLSARGSRPLVILATDALAISALVEVASHRMPLVRGAGAGPMACGAPEAAGEMEGGAGGSFGGRGGSGGIGEGDPPGPAAAPAVNPAVLRGGCRGGDGKGGGSSSDGGNGGGAIYLIAGASITITATGAVNASGAGGRRATENNEGGGGGGSGGMIALEAPTIAVSGQVFANGGGGGGGNESSEHGDEAASALVPARGGRDLDHSGHGGDGSAGAMVNGQDGSEGTDGGGGGGGGAGVIRVFPLRPLGGAVSPPPA